MTRKLVLPTLDRCHRLSPSQSNSNNSKPPDDAPRTAFQYDNSAALPTDASDSVDILGATIKGFPFDDAISIVENALQCDNTRHARDVEMIHQVAVLVEGTCLSNKTVQDVRTRKLIAFIDQVLYIIIR